MPPPNKATKYEKFKNQPIPKKLQHHLPNIERFLTDTWLPMYPMGARLRKLQRDIAFRMPRKERPGKLTYEQLMPFVGVFESKGLIRLREKATNGTLIITHPEEETNNENDTDRSPSEAETETR